jgi:RNA polymerase sigma-70 factor (ECF subfamily)
MNLTPRSDSLQNGGVSPAGAFVTTRWLLVVAAARRDTEEAEAALEKLCRTYWLPLYAYARRRGYGVEDAQDLTQAFFARLLERHWLACADEDKGRFRTFLLTAMERFLANEWDKERALKRGGGRVNAPIQLDTAETRYGVDPPDTRTPEQAYEYRWAVALLEEAVSRLELEYVKRRQQELFAALRPCLVGERTEQPYAELGARLGMGEGAVKVAVHRLRQRYRELLREEVAETLASPEEVDAEMKYLFGVLARGR